MPCRDPVRDVVKIKGDIHSLPRGQRHGRIKPATMRQIQNAIGHPRRRAIGVDMVQPHGNLRCRCVGLQPQADPWGTDDIGILVQRRRGKAGGARIISTLVTRHFGAKPDGAVFAAIHAAVLWRGHGYAHG